MHSAYVAVAALRSYEVCVALHFMETFEND
jgi:hypothetical protein